MLTPIILVLGLMVATAVIAYWSDNLGKKLGKKRVTLFGLRPKQTATLITITSSMPIMLFTLGALLAVHQPLRDALTKFEATRRDNAFLTKQNEVARKSIELTQSKEKIATWNAQEAERRASQANSVAREAQGKADKAQRKLAEAQANLAQATKLAKQAKDRENEALAGAREAKSSERQALAGERQAQGAEQAARSREQRAREQEKKANAAAQVAREKLQNARARLASANTELASANARLASAQSRLKTAQGQLASAQSQLTSAKADLASTQSNLASTQSKLASTREKILDQGATILAQESRVAQLRAEAEQSRRAAASARAELEAAQSRVVEVLSTPTLIPANEALAEETIAPRQGIEQVQRQLQNLVAEARVQARGLNKGAGPPNVDIEFPVLRYTLPDKTKIEIGRDEQFATWASQLASADAPSSVRVIAARSHTIKERSIEVLLIAVKVQTVFKVGDILASATINGRDSGARIFNQLQELVDKGRIAAEKEGVQPPVSRSVDFYATGTNERIFEALRSIQALNGPARVRILAAADLSTASPLSVRFEVRPAASPGQST